MARVRNSLRSLCGLLSLFSLPLMSCYTPDLTTQIYKCDRGKCPEDFYCIDNKYCTQVVPNCSIGGIEIKDGVDVCVGAPNPSDASTICTNGATADNCDASVQKTLCSGMGLDGSTCAYCCK